jgi:hypothetical protein
MLLQPGCSQCMELVGVVLLVYAGLEVMIVVGGDVGSSILAGEQTPTMTRHPRSVETSQESYCLSAWRHSVVDDVVGCCYHV